MNDRVLTLLDNYEFTVLRTWKGRGAIIFESSDGIKCLREYHKSREKLPLLENLLMKVEEEGICDVDHYAKTKEGEYWVEDRDGITYVVKDYHEGRECAVSNLEDVRSAASLLAKLHNTMVIKSEENRVVTLEEELSKHTRELVRIYKYLRAKSQKSDFELFLLKNYLPYLQEAKEVQAKALETDYQPLYAEVMHQGCYSHGDYQYHNVLFKENGMAVLNFEKATPDVPICDFTYFMRKVMEKNEWSHEVGISLMEAYDRFRPMGDLEKKQLYYRLLYPEKFWKVVNFYFNNAKSWIPTRNREKIEQFMRQEDAKKEFLAKYF